MYLSARRDASIAMTKQSLGVAAATTTAGHSPFLPTTACNKSACSVFVGKPVEGPPRCTLMITSGNSTATARPIASPLSATPGPDDEVIANCPANAAPTAEETAAISSSAWKVVTPKFLKRESSCKMSEAGVIG